MFATLPLLVSLLGTTLAQQPAKPVLPGELLDTAQTVEKGDVCFHPLFLPSSVGLSDRVDLKTTPFFYFDGPNLRVEVGLTTVGDWSFSVEPEGSTWWSREQYSAGATVWATKTAGDHSHTIGVGAHYGQTVLYVEETLYANVSGELSEGVGWQAETYTALGTPLTYGWAHWADDRTIWQARARVLPMAILQKTGVNYLRLEGSWTRAFADGFRVSLGLGLVSPDVPTTDFSPIDEALEEIREWPVPLVPFPTVAFWWRL
jgi:hypothetical protein